MVLDYNERRSVIKNRPRRQTGTTFMILLAVTFGLAFGLGILTGWYFFSYINSGRVSSTVQQPEALDKHKEPALTFYKTLTGGKRSVIGSGLNPNTSPKPTPVKPTQIKPKPRLLPVESPSQTPPATKQIIKKQPTVHSPIVTKPPVDSKKTPPAPDKANKEDEKFLVQIASYRTHKDAVTLRDRCVTLGIAAYLVEYRIPDKGIWFRVQVGRHLDKQSAHDLAKKLGKGAIVIPE